MFLISSARYFHHMKMETAPFRKTITAGYSDSFSARDVRPTSMMAYLEETAAEHCSSIGRDLFSLLDDGGGWVLTGGVMRMERYPRYGEEFHIDTWISGWKTFIGIREQRIVSADGTLLGEAGGRWVYWDMASRKPTPVPQVFTDTWYFNPDSPYRRLSGASAALPVQEAAAPAVSARLDCICASAEGDVGVIPRA